MDHTPQGSAMDVLRGPVTLSWAFAVYRLGIVPLVRSEMGRWEGAARSIPDPDLRTAALSALKKKGRNVEATAVFAILAPRSHRAVAARAMTALQIAVDYLDILGEQRAAQPLENGLRLHRALSEAVCPAATHSDWYRLHPQKQDGGYLADLVSSCQGEIAALPTADVVVPVAQGAARRCGEGQSHTHAAALGETGALEPWAARRVGASEYRWWEIAAGASSSVATHALIAAAADAGTTVAEAEAIDSTYFPSIGALTVLLDDLVDREQDLEAGEHNYMSYYEDSRAAADRLGAISRQARAATAGLRHRGRHAAILAGVAGFYLGAPAARSAYAAPIRARLIESLGWTVRLVQVATRSTDRG